MVMMMDFMMVNNNLVGGLEFVSWDDDIPNIWKNKIHVPNHQPDHIVGQHLVDARAARANLGCDV